MQSKPLITEISEVKQVLLYPIGPGGDLHSHRSPNRLNAESFSFELSD